MPVQDWNINTGNAYAGEQYGLATTNSQRLTFSIEDAAGQSHYGLAQAPGAKDNTCKLGTVKVGELNYILGVSMREIKLESRTRPGDGTILIQKGYPIGVMLSGPIMVKLAAPIAADKVIHVDAKGQFGGATLADSVEVANVVPLRFPATTGDVIPVMINVLPKLP